MIRIQHVHISLAGLLLVVSPLSGDQDEYRKFLESGDKSFADREFDKAVDAYGNAKKLAAQGTDSERQGEASLRLAGALRRLAEDESIEPKDTKKWNAVIAEYTHAMEVGTTAQKEFARNNLGVLYLRLKKPADAVEVFEKDLELTTADAHVYLFNYGRALEAKNRPDDAYKQYLASLKSCPNFAPAAKRALTLVGQRPEKEGVPAAVELCGRLLCPKAHQVELVGDALPKLFGTWKSGASDLLPVVVDYYIAAGVNSQSFKDVEIPRLEKIQESTKEFEIEFKALKRTFAFADLDKQTKPILTSVADVREQFGGQSRFFETDTRASAAFSRWLGYLGELNYHISVQSTDDDEVRSSVRRALQFDSAAFFVDAHNTAALVAAAGVIAQYRDFLDPKNQWVRELADRVFEVKGGIYLSSPTPANWANLYSIHVVLGELYRNQKPPVWGEVNDLHSALGQWSRAIEVEKLIRTGRSEILGKNPEPNPHFPESPVLRLQLAAACREKKDVKRAFTYYVDAAERFIDVGNPGRVHELMNEVDPWLKTNPFDMTEADKEKLAVLNRLSETMEAVLKATNPEVRWTGPVRVTALEFDSKGKRLAAASTDEMGVINLGDGKYSVQPSFLLSKRKSVAVVFAPGAERFAAATGTEVLVADSEKAEVVVHKLSHQAPVRAMLFSKNGKILASSTDKGLYTWDMKTGQNLESHEPGFGPVRTLAISPDSEILAAAGEKSSDIWLWPRGSSEPRKLKGHEAPVTTLAFLSGDKQLQLASGDIQGRLRLWDAATAEPLSWQLPVQSTPITRLGVMAEGKIVFVAAEGAPVRFFDREKGKELLRIPCPERFLTMSLSPDGGTLAMVSASTGVDGSISERVIQVWNIGPILKLK